MKRITITGVMDLHHVGDEREVNAAIDELRQYGVAEVTKVEDVPPTAESPLLLVADEWHGN